MSDHQPKKDGGNHQVGYCRPPLHSQFKLGQSGNPKGRPRGSVNDATLLTRVMNEKVTIRVGDTTQEMTKREAMLQGQVLKGINGDSRAAKLVFDRMDRFAVFGAPDEQGAVSDGTSDGDQLGPGDALFAGLDPALLSKEELIELSRLAEVIELGGDITALNTAEYERFKQLVNKGRGKSVNPESRRAA